MTSGRACSGSISRICMDDQKYMDLSYRNHRRRLYFLLRRKRDALLHCPRIIVNSSKNDFCVDETYLGGQENKELSVKHSKVEVQLNRPCLV